MSADELRAELARLQRLWQALDAPVLELDCSDALKCVPVSPCRAPTLDRCLLFVFFAHRALSACSPLARPHLRRLFSGDMLWTHNGEGAGTDKVEVTLEGECSRRPLFVAGCLSSCSAAVEGDGDEITSAFVLVERAAVPAPPLSCKVCAAALDDAGDR
jgi:hypothetical protein